MTNGHHDHYDHYDPVILQAAEDAVISYPVAPKALEVAAQGLAEGGGIG